DYYCCDVEHQNDLDDVNSHTRHLPSPTFYGVPQAERQPVAAVRRLRIEKSLPEVRERHRLTTREQRARTLLVSSVSSLCRGFRRRCTRRSRLALASASRRSSFPLP